METFVNQYQKRIRYIDALRGFTMFLVVLGHVMITSLNISRDSIVCTFFLSFRMPIFFFISGYIAYNATNLWTPSFFIQKIKKKAFVQIIPACLFFTLYFLSRHRNFGELCQYVINTGFGGYWFTFVLFEMFVIYYISSFIGKYIHNKITDILLILVCFFLLWFVHSEYNPQIGFLNLDNLFNYLKFFTFGILCKKYHIVFLQLINNDYFRTVVIMSFILSFYLILDKDILNSHFNYYMLLKNYTIRFTGLLTIFIFFHNKKSFFEKEKFFSRLLQYIGKRTLDIYLLHYFFIPYIPVCITSYITQTNMSIIQITLSSILSIIIIFICLLLSEIIRSSNILSHYCFGVDSKNKTS